MRILADQPYAKVRDLAELLGWRGLLLRHVTLDDGKLIIWYETTDREFHLQINPEPQGQMAQYQATVIATRYGIPLNAVGFHNFSIGERQTEVRDAAECLRATLGRSNFKNREWRRRFDVLPKGRRGKR